MNEPSPEELAEVLDNAAPEMLGALEDGGLAGLDLKRLDYALDVKALEEPGSFEGHASMFGKEDMGRDTIMRGAFKGSLAELRALGRMPAMLWQHDTRQPIGVWEVMREDRRGLFVQGRLLIEDIPQARAAHALLKEGGLSGLSIGFQTLESDTNEKTGKRKIKEVRLWEVSLVTFPMLDSARVEAVKSRLAEVRPEDITTKRELENALRDAGFSHSTAAFVTAHWQPPALRDAGGDLSDLAQSLKAAAKTLTG